LHGWPRHAMLGVQALINWYQVRLEFLKPVDAAARLLLRMVRLDP
jgi:hypothetical protein